MEHLGAEQPLEVPIVITIGTSEGCLYSWEMYVIHYAISMVFRAASTRKCPRTTLEIAFPPSIIMAYTTSRSSWSPEPVFKCPAERSHLAGS